METVFVAIPSYNGQISSRLSAAVMNESREENVPPFTVGHKTISLLAFGFNQLWCTALNNRHQFTHFLMLHADVIPRGSGWLRALVEEMKRVDADILSVVLPLKNEMGITSTALIPNDEFAHALGDRPRRKRLTLHEIQSLPESFDVTYATTVLGLDYYPDPLLLVNTGFMLVDLRKPWVEKCYFTIQDRVWQREDGKFACDVEPEDWYFSARAAEEGAKVWATRIVHATHLGDWNYSNQGDWGTVPVDPGTENGQISSEPTVQAILTAA